MGSARGGDGVRNTRNRRHGVRYLGLVAVAVVVLAGCLTTTYGGGDTRTGWFSTQPGLTPAVVGSDAFGEVWHSTVSGAVDGQPLLHERTILAATETNDVYGLDEVSGAPRWHRQVGVPYTPAVSCADLPATVGVTGTPVIDPDTDTAYFVAKTYVSGTSGPAAAWAHAVDVATGAERPGFPLLLAGTAANDPGAAFSATTQLQRPGLLLMGGVVYAGFGGQCDDAGHRGWVIGFTTAGQLSTLWTTEAGGAGAGIAQAGGGLVSDAPGQIVVTTGDGAIPAGAAPGGPGVDALGQAVVRLEVQPDHTLEAVDFFIPSDAAQLNATGRDLGTGGPVVLPSTNFGTAAHPSLGLQIGASGQLYVLDQADLGGYQDGPGGTDRVIQRLGPFGGAWSKPGVWPGDGGYVYVTTASDGTTASGSTGQLRALQYGLDGAGKPTFTPAGVAGGAFGFGSGSPVVSSNGTQTGSALVWVIWSPDASGNGAQLRAYDPVPVGGTLPLRRSLPIGRSSMFSVPLVAGNHVVIGTRDGTIRSFGAPVAPPLRVGSALNSTGTDPDIANTTGGNDPHFWVNSAGLTSSKLNGDRYTAGLGDGAFAGNCAAPITNCEYQDSGYVFLTKVDSIGTGPLKLQVYDPATIDVGDFCTYGNSSAADNLVDMVAGAPNANIDKLATQFTNAGITTTPSGQPLNPRERWGRIAQQPDVTTTARAKRYCDGDWINGWTAASAPKTTWIVRAPDSTPFDNFDNPPICAITFDSYSGNVFNKLSSTTNPLWNTSGAAQTATEKVPFWTHFRQFFTICNVASPQVGTYVIQVRNNADTTNLGTTPQTSATPGLNLGTLGGPGSTAPGYLHNRFSIRAGWGGAAPAAAPPDSAWSHGLTVYPDGKLGMYLNQGNSPTTFKLVRVAPQYAGKQIRVNLWDLGDGADVNLAIRAPIDSSPGAITSCTWQRDGVAWPFTLSGACGVNGLTTGNFNGRLTSATIQVSPSYTCNPIDPEGCWFVIDVNPVAGNPNDSTTWSAEVVDSP